MAAGKDDHMTLMNIHKIQNTTHVLRIPASQQKLFYTCCLLLLCACAVCSVLLQQGNTSIFKICRCCMLLIYGNIITIITTGVMKHLRYRILHSFCGILILTGKQSNHFMSKCSFDKDILMEKQCLDAH